MKNLVHMKNLIWGSYSSQVVSVGDRNRNLKFSMHHQDQSMESSSNERERSASTYPCRSLAEAFKKTGLMELYSS